MKTITTIEVLEVGGKPVSQIETRIQPCAVSNHHLYPDCVVLEVQGERITVRAGEVVKAVQNATNV